MSRRVPSQRVLVVIGSAIILTGCLPEAATDRGREVAQLYGWFMLAAAGVFAVVVGLLGFAIIRYRGHQGPDGGLASPMTGHMGLEVTWWAIPVAIVIVLAILTAVVLTQVDAHADEPDLVVEVAGFQWGWRFTYPESGVVVVGTAEDPPEIELPVGETIAFEITSRDVIHSFYLPDFLIKRDAVPNRPNRIDVVIEMEGTYGGQCAEFCGLLHARQLFSIDAVQPDAFQAWLGDQQAEAGAAP